MLNNANVRSRVAGVLEPPARGLLRLGVSPDAVTVVGTMGVVVASVGFLARGEYLWAVVVSLLFAPSDMLDGTMARLSGRSGPWGAFLDSTLDRIGDGAVFGGLAFYLATTGERWPAAAALLVLVGALVVSYSKARAEGVGAECNVGIAERAERLVILGVAVLLAGFGVPYVLPVALWLLAALVWITVGQRIWHVRGQLRATPGAAPGPQA